ncbi:MAG: hypothetical protein C0582_01025 [Alphaproteobacteria bacterium]|nr:MAG: hypothetical protein C0582_01025 [Alphaproteobacteria bacterium]
MEALNQAFTKKTEEGKHRYSLLGEKGVIPKLTSVKSLVNQAEIYQYNELLMCADPIIPSLSQGESTRQVCWIMDEIDYYTFCLFTRSGKIYNTYMGLLDFQNDYGSSHVRNNCEAILKSDLPIYVINPLKKCDRDLDFIRKFMGENSVRGFDEFLLSKASDILPS